MTNPTSPDSKSEIVVCPNHQDDEVTPLIWTFAFIGAEYWCPYCGRTSGAMGGGDRIDSTLELEQRLTSYKRASRQYIRGNGLQICSQTKYHGKWIKFSEMPDRAKTFWRNKAKSWIYKGDEL